jgi:hypothetical protein
MRLSPDPAVTISLTHWAQPPCLANNESGHIACSQLAKVRSPIVKSLGQELLNDRHVVEQCGLGQTAFLGQTMTELADYFGPGSDLDCSLFFHNACLAKHGQESTQCFPIASADPMLPRVEAAGTDPPQCRPDASSESGRD